MTPQQQKFADAYLSGMSKARAYMMAYPKVQSIGSASTNAGRLLKNAEIKDYIASRQAEISHSIIQKAVADAEEIARFRTAVMRGEVMEKIARFDPNGEPALIEVPANIKNRLAAADALENQLGSLSASGGGPPKIIIRRRGEEEKR